MDQGIRLLVVMLSGLLFGTPSVSALDRGKALTVTDDAEEVRLMSAVENAIWAADGNNTDKPVYVVYSTECAWSKRLFEQSRQLADKVQLRWIPVGVTAAPDVVATRSSGSVADAFSGKRAIPADLPKAQRGVAYNFGVMNSITYQLRPHDGATSFVFPSLIYQTAEGVEVVAGIPDNLEAMANDVVSTPAKASIQPAAIELTSEPIKVVASPHLKVYGHIKAQPVELFLAPSEKAAPLESLEKDFNVNVSGVVTESGWIETLPWGSDGLKAYVHDPVLARLATMAIPVKPQGGVVLAEAPLSILRFPDPESPALMTLDAGYQMDRSGVVELNGQTWDQVVVYSDGTKGYVQR